MKRQPEFHGSEQFFPSVIYCSWISRLQPTKTSNTFPNSNGCVPKKVQNYKIIFQRCIPKNHLQKLYLQSNLQGLLQSGIESLWERLGMAGCGWRRVESHVHGQPGAFGVLMGKTDWLCNSGPCGRLVGTGWEVLSWSCLVQRWVEIKEGEASVYCGHRGIGRYQFKFITA